MLKTARNELKKTLRETVECGQCEREIEISRDVKNFAKHLSGSCICSHQRGYCRHLGCFRVWRWGCATRKSTFFSPTEVFQRQRKQLFLQCCGLSLFFWSVQGPKIFTIQVILGPFAGSLQMSCRSTSQSSLVLQSGMMVRLCHGALRLLVEIVMMYETS